MGRSDVELAAIEQLRAAGVESVAARYDAETQAVQVTAWTDEPADTAERVDEFERLGFTRIKPKKTSAVAYGVIRVEPR